MELSIETMPIAFINNKQPNFGLSYKDILSIRVLVLLSMSFLEGGEGIWERKIRHLIFLLSSYHWPWYQ